MPLRRQQEKLRKLVNKISTGAPINEIFLPWAVGAGKSIAPVILSDLLTDNKKQVVLIPRNTLKQQGEAEYSNDIYPVNKLARIANNSGDPWRGCHSCFVTFQAVCMNPEKWIKIFEENEIMLVMDEVHHLSGHGDWIKTIKRLEELSFLSVYMTGTPYRGDNTKIPFFKYDENHNVDFSETENRKCIIYTNEDALRDGAVLPYDTTLIDGSGSYIDLSGITRHFKTLGNTGDNLRCVFDSEYAYHFIDLVFSYWFKIREQQPWSKILIVSPNIKIAKKYTEYIKNKYPNIRSGIATSEDSKDCIETVKRAKLENNINGSIECLISVGIAYEGLNIVQITHIAVISLIRSMQWIQQCLGRCQRRYGNKTQGYVFAPEDDRMKKIIKQISSGSINSATADPPELPQSKPDQETTGSAQTIEALSSKAHLENLGFPEFQPPQKIHETQSEIETRLRKEINTAVNKIVGETGNGNKHIKSRVFWLKVKMLVNHGRDDSGKLKRKKIEEMTIPELKKISEFCKNNY